MASGLKLMRQITQRTARVWGPMQMALQTVASSVWRFGWLGTLLLAQVATTDAFGRRVVVGDWDWSNSKIGTREAAR